MNTKQRQSTPFFQPSFGSRPQQIIGRDAEINDFLLALKEPVGSRDRCTFFLGQRGMGKTALLLELQDRAESEGFVVARVTAHEKMAESIIEQIQLRGAQFVREPKRSVKGISAGALGFSFGLTFSETTQSQYGFRAKLTLLCDKLAEHNKGILILIDETQTSAAMREVASTFQELVGEGKNVAIAMAGLPHAVSHVLNDSVLTFLNRAHKVKLGLLSLADIRAYYAHVFREIGIAYDEASIDKAAELTHGFPYLMQLVGYYAERYAQDTKQLSLSLMSVVEKAAITDMEQNVFVPILAPLSDNDRIFLKALAQCAKPATTSELQERLGKNGPALQPYRKRLLEAGIIEAPRRAELVFAVPLLSEYLLK